MDKCPEGLLPDGEICPRCGRSRAPSGIDGGTWVHFPSTLMKNSVSDQSHPSVNSQPMVKPTLIPTGVNLGDELTRKFYQQFRDVEGYPINGARIAAKKERLKTYIQEAKSLDELKLCLLEWLNKDRW